jgi:hypothetical protein
MPVSRRESRTSVDNMKLFPRLSKRFVTTVFGSSEVIADFDCAAKIHAKGGGGMGY